MKKGIDVSEWQGTIDWETVRASGVEFAILRAGYGRVASQKDKTFDANYFGCKAANIPCGAYWYSYATSEDEARQEAATCLDILKYKQLEYPVYYDVEEQRTLGLGKEKVSAVIKAFCDVLEKAGYFAGLYMSAYPLGNLVSEEVRNRYAVWVAHYGVTKPVYSGKYGIWQKCSTGTVPGIAGNVDLNEAYEDYPEIIKAAELNNWKAAEEKKHRLRVYLDDALITDHEFSGLID